MANDILAIVLTSIIFACVCNGYIDKEWDLGDFYTNDLTLNECAWHCLDMKKGWTCTNVHLKQHCVIYRQRTCTYHCICGGCRRDCALEEVECMPSACEIKDIPAIRNDSAGKVTEVMEDLAIGLISIAEPWSGLAMAFGKGMFGALQGDDEEKSIIKDINERTDQLIKCMGAMISKQASKDQIDEMQGALELYNFAEEADRYAKDLDPSKATITWHAWAEFGVVITSKFDNRDEDPLFYKNLLIPLQNFAALYSLLSVDYLAFMKVNSEPDFQETVRDTLNLLGYLIVWTHNAKSKIVNDFVKNLNGFPCRNDDALMQNLTNWKVRFDIANIYPIVKYYNALDGWNDLSDDADWGSSVDPIAQHYLENIPSTRFFSNLLSNNVRVESSQFPVIHVISTENTKAPDGQYFNFRAWEGDAMLFGDDWNGIEFELYKCQTRYGLNGSVSVKLWRHAEGGSYGDARGRIQPLSASSAGQWSAGSYPDSDADGDILALDKDSCPPPPNPYMLNPTKMTWDEAEAFCLSTYGTHLATITSDAQRDRALELVDDFAWIGFHQSGSPTWWWVDGTSCSYVPGSAQPYWQWCERDPRWAQGEPTRGAEYCVRVRTADGKYNNVPCGWKVASLCKAPSALSTDDAIVLLSELELDALKMEGDICEFDAIESGDDANQFEVLEVEQSSIYFHFDSSQLDQILGRKRWRRDVLMVYNERTDSMMNVMIWNDGHARKHPRRLAKYGDWKVGDMLTVVGDNCENGLRCLAKREDGAKIEGADDGKFKCQSIRARLLSA